MATTRINPTDLDAAVAASDLSAKQFCLVKLNDAGGLTIAGAGDIGFALQDKPSAGETGTYAVGGRPKAIAGGTIKAGALLSADANGHIVAATATAVAEEKVTALGTHIVGIAAAPGVSGDLVPFYAVGIGGRA